MGRFDREYRHGRDHVYIPPQFVEAFVGVGRGGS